jgi:hypothetical protein
MADMLHSHISALSAATASASSLDLQNQEKMQKALEMLARKQDENAQLSFDGISWHRLLVRSHTSTRIHNTTLAVFMKHSMLSPENVNSFHCSVTSQWLWPFLFFCGFPAANKTGGQPLQQMMEK